MDEDSRLKELWENYWYVAVIAILIIIPFAINYFVQVERLWDVAGDATNWLAFWPSYFSAAVSLIMIIYTAKTLRNNEDLLLNNKIQLEELRQQWIHEHFPEITASFHTVGNRGYLRIVNVSKVEVQDLHIVITKDPSKKTQKLFGDYYAFKKKLESLCLDIEKDGIRNILLMDNINEEISPNEYIEMDITHRGIPSNYKQEVVAQITMYFNDMCIIGDILPMKDETDKSSRRKKSNKQNNKKE